jgi:predicted GIY-YIG superfamily endonuclease
MNQKSYKQYPHFAGIYQIKNILTNKIYIGSATDLHRRLRKHFYELEQQVHRNQYLQRSYDKYGKDSLEVTILEEFKNHIDYNKLLEIEKSYIIKYNSIENGYNMILEPNNIFQKININSEHIHNNTERCSIAVMAFDMNTGKLINEFKSLTDAAKYFNDQTTNISSCCNGKINYIKGAVFCYSSKYDQNRSYIYIKQDRKFSELHKNNLQKAITKFKGIKVYQYDENFNLVKEYESRSEAERQLGLNIGKIKYMRNKITPVDGYYWRDNKI